MGLAARGRRRYSLSHHDVRLAWSVGFGDYANNGKADLLVEAERVAAQVPNVGEVRGQVLVEVDADDVPLLAELGGEDLVGQATTVPDGLFADVQ